MLDAPCVSVPCAATSTFDSFSSHLMSCLLPFSMQARGAQLHGKGRTRKGIRVRLTGLIDNLDFKRTHHHPVRLAFSTQETGTFDSYRSLSRERRLSIRSGQGSDIYRIATVKYWHPIDPPSNSMLILPTLVAALRPHSADDIHMQMLVHAPVLKNLRIEQHDYPSLSNQTRSS